MNSPDYWERRKKLEELEEALARTHRNISWLREVMAELERLGEADSAAVDYRASPLENPPQC
jgi:hypothetical protein